MEGRLCRKLPLQVQLEQGRLIAIEHPRQGADSSWRLVRKRLVARSSYVTVASV
jgi:hypothetical protein